MRFEVVKVTPRVASEWLARPWTRQRSLSQPVVAKYARAMTDGRWEEPSLDPIGFTPDGELANGQHRLSAVIKAGWVGDMLIAFDVPAENFLVHDTGRRRIASQFVRIPRAKVVAAIARLVLWYDNSHPAPPRGPAASFDNDELLAFIDANEDDLLTAATSAEQVAKKTGIPGSVHGAILFIAARGEMDPDRIASWVDGLASGAGLSVGDPRLALRERIARVPAIRRDQVALWYLITRAFNAYMHGRDISKLNGDTSGPTPVVKIKPYSKSTRNVPGPVPQVVIAASASGARKH